MELESSVSHRDFDMVSIRASSETSLSDAPNALHHKREFAKVDTKRA